MLAFVLHPRPLPRVSLSPSLPPCARTKVSLAQHAAARPHHPRPCSLHRRAVAERQGQRGGGGRHLCGRHAAAGSDVDDGGEREEGGAASSGAQRGVCLPRTLLALIEPTADERAQEGGGLLEGLRGREG